MKNENSEVQAEHGKSRTFKIIRWVLIGGAGLVLLLFLGIPLYLSSSGGTNLLLGKVNQSVDGQVQMDDFSIGWFKGIKLTNLSYADTAGTTSVSVRRIETQPHYTSLLGGKVKLGKTVIDRPQIYLKVSPEKEQPAGMDAPKTKPSAEPMAFPIDQIDLELIDGAATIELAGDMPQTVKFANIASKVHIAQAGAPSSLAVSMNVNDDAKITANGTATADKKGWTLKEGDFDVQVSKLQLASLKPLFALAGQEIDMAGELNADATVQIVENQVKQLNANAVITNFAQGTGEQRMVFDKPIRVTALAQQDGAAVKIDQLNVESEFCNVRCSGTTEALTYAVDADLAQTQRLIGQFTDMAGLTMQGKLTADGSVSMAEQVITAAGKGTVTQLVVQKDALRTPVTNMQMDFDCTVDQAKNQLRLASANLAAAPGTVKIVNLVLPMDEQADKTISLDAQAKLDLAQTWVFAQVFTELPKDVQVVGMLDSAVKVSTQGSELRIRTDKAQIDNLEITRPDSDPFVQDRVSLNADILLDTDAQTIDVKALDMQGSRGESLIKVTKGKIEKKVSQKTTKLTGDFQAQYDLKTLSAFASAYLPAGLTMEGKRSDALRFDSEYPTEQPELMKANLNAFSAFGFDKAAYQGLNFGPTQVTLNVKKGQAAIDMPDADVNGGKVRFAGDVNLAEEPMMLRLRKSAQVVENVKIDDIISAQLLQYLNPVFAQATGVTGTANLSCNTLAIPLGGGTPKDIDMAGAIGLTDVRLNSPLLGLFKQALKTEGLDLFAIPSSPFTVKNGLVQYADMPMVFGGRATFNFSGTIGLEDQALAMTVKAPIGDRILPVPLGGTLIKPKLDTSKLIESQGRQLIEQEVQKQLERLFR
jgi:hypothetical protein